MFPDRRPEIRYELTIQDGPDQYVAIYRQKFFHNKSKDLTTGHEVQFRIAEGNLFVKMPDGKEIKAGLCRNVLGSFVLDAGNPQGALICP